MIGNTVYSFKRATHSCYLDLINLHCRLLGGPAASRSRGGYVLDTAHYLAPTPENLNRQVLTRSLMRTYAADAADTETICSIIFDAALWSDYYAMARLDAQEQAMQVLGSVLQEQPRGSFPVAPVLDGDVIKLSEDACVATYIESQLNQVKVELQVGNNGGVFAAHERLQGVSRVLHAAEQAFKAARASLKTFDIESVLKDLVQNEVLSELS